MTFHSMRKKTFIYLLLFITGILGCGGSSGDSTDSMYTTANLCVGKKSYEGGTINDVLYAVVGGTGITGGWIEDNTGNKLSGSDLQLENLTGKYQTVIEKSAGTILGGTYILKYFINGEVNELKIDNMLWTNAPQFNPAPNPPEYNPIGRSVTVRYQPVSGSNVRYFLRIFSVATGSLYRESDFSYGPEISEYLPMSGSYIIELNAEVIENQKITGVAKHRFTTPVVASSRAP